MSQQIQPRSDLTEGTAFAAARAALADVAGDAFRRLVAMKADPQATPAEVDQARKEAHSAQARMLALRPSDAAAIRAALERS